MIIRRDGSKFKGCNPLQHNVGWIGLNPAIAYFAYNEPSGQVKIRHG